VSVPVQRLGAYARDDYARHLLALDATDRRLRFGAPIGDAAIEAYVARIDYESDVVFAVHDDRLALAAAAHVATSGDTAELGVSVLPDARGRGHGSALVVRAAEFARNRRVRRLWMHCLAENAQMMRIARRAGMAIVVDTGEADASLALAPANSASFASEFAADQVALFDYALKSSTASIARAADAVRSGR
jgi:GNAT superfamily N-acetyltransferase